MTEKTMELDTTTEPASPNGHQWQTFDDDQALLHHILSKQRAEKLIDVPEWETQILCRALNAEDRVKVQMVAYIDKIKGSDYRRAVFEIIAGGCYNPVTRRKTFNESHREVLMHEQDGRPAEVLFITILQLSGMLAGDAERVKKN